MKPYTIPCLALILVGTAGSLRAGENPTLTFRDSEHLPIPLNAAQPVEITAEGNIEATCIFQQDNPQRCVNVGTQVSGEVPDASFTANLDFVDGSTTIYAATSGQQFTIARTITGTADFCVTSVSGAAATVQGWSTVPATSGNSSVSISATVPAGETRDVTLGLRCYNTFGAPEDIFQRTFRISPPAGPNPGACTLPSHPLIRPQGFTENVRTWPQVFNGFQFPMTPTFAMPVGSFSVTLNTNNSPPSAGMYLAIPVSLPDNARLAIATFPATGESRVGYNAARQGSVFISLSPCSGDLRPLNPAGSDVFERCSRGFVFEGNVVFSSLASAGACRYPPGDYWLNIIHANPAAPGFSDPAIGPTLNSCRDNLTRCESNTAIDFRTQ